MTAVGSSIFLLSSQATNPMAYGEQLIAARDPETGKTIAQVYTMNSDGISIETDGDDSEGRSLESLLLEQSRRSFLFDQAPSSVPGSGSDMSSSSSSLVSVKNKAVAPWWMPTRLHSGLAAELAEQYKRAAHRSRCVFFSTLPHFQDVESVKQLEGLMGTESFEVEIFNKGVARGQKRMAFTMDGLLRLHRDQNGIYEREGDHSHVFVSFDPAAGGLASNGAIVSAIYDDDNDYGGADFMDVSDSGIFGIRARQRLIVSSRFPYHFLFMLGGSFALKLPQDGSPQIIQVDSGRVLVRNGVKHPTVVTGVDRLGRL